MLSTFTIDKDGNRRIKKDPDAVLDYTEDWAKWLARDGDTLAAASFTAETGLTVDSFAHTTTEAIVWLSGGTAGQSYLVTCHITTTGGRQDDRSFFVDVIER